jgi:hypothetical protein
MAEIYMASSTPVVYLGKRYPVGDVIPAAPGDLDDLIELGVVSVTVTPDPKPVAAPKPVRAAKAVRKHE